LNLTPTITNSKSFLSPQWKEKYISFLEEEHWNEFVSKLVQHVQEGTPFVSELPYFEEEIRIPEAKITQYFFVWKWE
jgi:hypothetical protein